MPGHRPLLIYLRLKASGSNSVVECQLPKLDVAGSTPVSRSNFSIAYSFPILKACSKMLHFTNYMTGRAPSSLSTASLRRATEARVYTF